MKHTYTKNGAVILRRQRNCMSREEMRTVQLRINGLTRQSQSVIGSQPASLAEVSRAPQRSAKQGALAKRRAA